MNNPKQNEKTASTQKDVPAQQQQGQSSSDSKNTQQGGTDDKNKTEIKKGADAGTAADAAAKTSK